MKALNRGRVLPIVLLSGNRQGESSRTRTTKSSLLTGLLFDEDGSRFTPTHAQKGGKRYRYYTSQAVIRRSTKDDSIGRIPALDLEQAVVERILVFLGTPLEILNAAKETGGGEGNYERLLKCAAQKACEWADLPALEQETLFRSIVDRVVAHRDSVEIRLNSGSLFELFNTGSLIRFRDRMNSANHRPSRSRVPSSPFSVGTG